ncbi:hypothetical protein [uncultured Mediterranean phage uvMED]|nr:MAG: hypothetical protein CBD88_00120 [Flavobacteriales bacterium TMED228]BAQ87713.1 hypothetical protein [uncultured Mediterranean phage uvMED]BAQ87781.1 hypothetical protein [uncultured Mediterranean phage uvMED]|tara:strand:- start:53 stop:364 length:312 start_codon:yes stop_codon:yes gene_type:complete
MDIDKDLQYLAETDVPYSNASAELDYQKDELKHTKGVFVTKLNASVSKAQEEFYANQEYKIAIDKIYNAQVTVNSLRNKRATAILRIDVWRTLEASRRKGNIQ